MPSLPTTRPLMALARVLKATRPLASALAKCDADYGLAGPEESALKGTDAPCIVFMRY
jgi:hypothetical protein